MKLQALLFISIGFGTSIAYSQKQTVETDNLSFSSMRSIENKGQWMGKILFKTAVGGGDMYLENDGFTYSFMDEKDAEEVYNHHHKKASKHNHTEILHFHGLKMKFINSNKKCKVEGINSYITNYNYYKGNDPAKWGTGAKAYKGIEYSELYNGIDMYLYEKEGNKKYDFVVAPNSNPSQISLSYQGADKIYIENGDLHINTSVNYIIEKQPKAFQYIDGDYVNVECNFILDDDKNVHFDFPNGYDKSAQLIIDPVLIFSTLTGSTGDNWGNTATYDDNGNAYSGGIAFKGGAFFYSGYPVTTGAFQTSYSGGNSDVAISKYTPDGTSILYATYLGGFGDDVPVSMIVNSNNELIILGNTNSSDFPTQGAYDNTLNNGSGTSHDLFITILSSNGTSLVGSTYMGGGNDDGFNAIVYFYSDEHRSEVIIDELDNIYVASNTNSADFPTTGNSFDNSINGSQDGCVFKMNSNVSSLIWSGFLGGSGLDNASGIVLDDFNNVFVCGATEGNGFTITPGTINQTFLGGLNNNGITSNMASLDGFVTKIASDGASVLASTYIQSTTAVFDLAYLIDTDVDGNIYVFGNTEGAYLITNGVYNNGESAQFIHKLTPDLDSTLLSTTFGSGTVNEVLSPTAFLVDDCNRIYVSGWGGVLSFFNNLSTITGFPTTPDAFKSTTTGDDFYLGVFNEDMVSLEYATYFGGDISGEHVDGGTSRFSPDGVVYQSVCASCGGNSDFPTTPGVVSQFNGSANCNNGLFKMEFSKSNVKAQINESFDTTQMFCIPALTKLENYSRNGSEFTWFFGDGNSLTTSSDSTIIHQYNSEGIYVVELVSYNPALCFDKHYDTAHYTVNVFEVPIADAGNDTTIESCMGIELKGCCGPFYSWSPSELLSDNKIPNPRSSAEETQVFVLTITDSLGCTGVDSIKIELIDVELIMPNVFTPNGDGFNEYLKMNSNCIFDLILYNRWGKEVYKQEEYQNNFDGSELNDGIYYYVIKNETQEYKGWVQILR